ncbi:cytochrome b5-like heme/steroid binding domain-containing protein [Leptodontidium sp. 2 PMI_412]|nr:cytochrome b5-like heme/steroid binding domain-containing protein [Leptodontidium sp. 2 PMI_412]
MSGDSRLQIPFSEVQKHVSADDCWLVIKDVVYNVTDFLKIHPGGPGLVFAEAGTDATLAFAMFRSPNTLNKMPPQTRLGLVDRATLPPPEQKAPAADEAERQKAREEMPPAHGMTLLPDFEVWAQKVLSTVAWA